MNLEKVRFLCIFLRCFVTFVAFPAQMVNVAYAVYILKSDVSCSYRIRTLSIISQKNSATF